MFSKAPLKRTEPLVKKVKKKTETGIHSDEELEKTLLEIDATEEMYTKNIKPEPIDTESCRSGNTNLIEIKKQKEANKLSSPIETNSSASKELTSDKNKTGNSKVNSSKRKFEEFTEPQITPDNENVSTKKKKCDSDEKGLIYILTVNIGKTEERKAFLYLKLYKSV